MNPGSIPARILVVDDQESNVQVLGNMLSQQGFEIVPVTDGEHALQRLITRPADLVLLDVLMPGLDGFEVCRRIHARPELADIPIVFLSAADDKTFIVRALEAGGVDYVTKPFNKAELISRVRTHLALKQARDRLRQLAEDKDELLGILAHDLKNHLGGMQMSAQLLNDRINASQDNRLKRIANNILSSSEQMLAFVKEFLANSAADRGAPLKLVAASLTESAAAAVLRYAEAARRKKITFVEAYASDTPFVLADRAALDQVIDNLVSNAVKFSPEGKRITIQAGPGSNGRGELRVVDEGPGCTDEDRAQMFLRYRRLSARPTAGEPSTGLGLSIAKRHVTAMKGELNCESIPGEGATFILRLPSIA
ncbi:MAG: response regulator receiver sensor signal transduction histidine kinase [Verrucomicrobia bacterium]|nr:response regulator receiver sensor signal transduction histidine kinase [Verrucomicrobiota bacterium]